MHSGVIQHCLSDGILKRDFVFGILTRGFILLITEVEIAVEEFADKNATQQGSAQQ